MKRKKNDLKSTLERALENPRLKSQYLKKVEKLFQGAKGQPGHDKDLARLHESYGTARFKKYAKNYVKKYGLPDDWGALMLLLDLEDESSMVIEAMEKLVKLSETRSIQERRGLKSKLKTLSLTSSNIEVAETAGILLEEF